MANREDRVGMWVNMWVNMWVGMWVNMWVGMWMCAKYELDPSWGSVLVDGVCVLVRSS